MLHWNPTLYNRKIDNTLDKTRNTTFNPWTSFRYHSQPNQSEGDLHDIGKNLVALMLEGAGFEIKDLGVDVPIEDFIRVVQEEKPDIVAMSALLTTTMSMMKQTIDAFETAGLRDKVKFLIGGAPVTETYANQIGADGFSSDASRAVNMAKSLVGI